MIINRIEIRNYRRFAAVDLELPENLIGIIGRNGSGKTTLVEAIGWALYGNAISRTSKQDVRSQFASEREPCSVLLEFTYGGESYRIERRLKGKNAIAEAAIYRAHAQEPEAVQDRGVNEYVEHLLRLDYRSFYASVFARQRELAALSAMQPEERRKSINRLIGIDRIDRAREMISADRNQKQSYVAGLEKGLLDLESLRQRIQENAQALDEVLQRIQSHSEVMQQKESALRQARNKLETQSDLRDRYLQFAANLSKWQALKRENESALLRQQKDLEAITAAEKELGGLLSELQQLPVIKDAVADLDRERVRQTELEGLQRQMQEMERHRMDLNGRIDALKKRIADPGLLNQKQAGLIQSERKVEQELAESREQSRFWHGEVQVSQQAGLELRDKRSRIEQLGPEGECPTCTQRLADHYEEVLRQLDDKLAELREKYRLARESQDKAQAAVQNHELFLQNLRLEKEQLLQQISVNQESSATLQQAEADMAATSQRIAGLAAAMADMGTIAYDAQKHDALRQQLEKLNQTQQTAAKLRERVDRREWVASEIARLQALIEELERMIANGTEEQGKLGFNESEYMACKRAVDLADEALTHARETQAQLREEAAGLKKEQQNLRETEAQQQTQRSMIETLREEIVYLEFLNLHFGKFRLELAGRLRPMIALQASQLLSLTTNGRYVRMVLDEDYAISLYDGNQAFPLARFSGGEQDLVNLCLRIAISQIVAQRSGGASINFIVLDEIFGSQDEERKNLILAALGQLSSQFRQVFIITHIESIRDALPVILEVACVDDRCSEVRQL